MKRYAILIILFLYPLVLFSQVDGTEDFYFSSLEEEAVLLNLQARETGNDQPSVKLQLAQEAYSLAIAEQLYETQVDALATMGTAYFYLLEIDKSLEALKRSYELANRINYSEGHWYSAYILGTIHAYLEDPEIAEAYFSEADQLVIPENDIKHISVFKELVKIYISQKFYEKAATISTEALLMSEILDEEGFILELTLLSGEIQFLAGNIRRANNLLRDIITKTSALGEYQEIRASALSLMGKCYALLGDYHMALANGQDALLLSVKNDSDQGRLEAYDSLSYIYQLMDDFERAYLNLQLYYRQKEFLEKEKNTGNLNKIKAYYGTFEKEQEIDKQQLQIETQNRLILAGSLMIAVFIVLLLIFYLLYRKNSRIAEKLSRDLKRELILSKTDPVTGLSNRKDIEDLIQKAIAAWKKDYINFSLLFLSIESYKKIDREWGEGSGEKLQKFIGNLLKSELKGQDVVAVWKPFLFLILLPETDQDSLKSVRHKLNLRFSRVKYIQDERETVLILNMGTSTYSGDGNRSDCIERCREELNKDRQESASI
jgi:diguanylate cyclase (GGDEF)-like protein